MSDTLRDFGEIVAEWANRMSSVRGLVLIGSRACSPADKLQGPDSLSDWDYQIITSDSAMFTGSAWTKELIGTNLRAYAPRMAIRGGVPKINALFDNAAADLVIIPSRTATFMKAIVALGLHRRYSLFHRRLHDLAEVLGYGWRFVKGGEHWGPVYDRIFAEIHGSRLLNDAIIQLAEGFVCDYIWTIRKITRGELITAQRTIYLRLQEVNLQLLHELRQRRDEKSIRYARRIERIVEPEELASVTIEATINPARLKLAAEKCANTFRDLMTKLVGDAWHWPNIC